MTTQCNLCGATSPTRLAMFHECSPHATIDALTARLAESEQTVHELAEEATRVNDEWHEKVSALTAQVESKQRADALTTRLAESEQEGGLAMKAGAAMTKRALAAEAELARLRPVVEAVRAIHHGEPFQVLDGDRRERSGVQCSACYEPWPCPTINALEAPQ